MDFVVRAVCLSFRLFIISLSFIENKRKRNDKQTFARELLVMVMAIKIVAGSLGTIQKGWEND